MTSVVPFETENPFDPEWTEKAYDMVLAGRIRGLVEVRDHARTEKVSGPCPRCADEFEHSAPAAAVSSGGGVLGNERALLATDWTTISLYCACGGTHTGRPGGRDGCGIAYSVPARVVSV